MYLRRLSFNELNSHAGDESSHYLKLLAIHLPSIHRLDCSSLPLEEWMSLWPPGPTAPPAAATAAMAAAAAAAVAKNVPHTRERNKGGEEGPIRKRLRRLDVEMKEVEEGSCSVSLHLFVE